jgi:hypothetical protein
MNCAFFGKLSSYKLILSDKIPHFFNFILTTYKILSIKL